MIKSLFDECFGDFINSQNRTSFIDAYLRRVSWKKVGKELLLIKNWGRCTQMEIDIILDILYNLRMKPLSILLLAFLFFTVTGPARTHDAHDESLNPVIARWYDNHAAAISITYDDGNPSTKPNKLANSFVLENGLTMDYELVTYDYLHNPDLQKYFLNRIAGKGLGYFGHGHTHVNHDRLTYEEALKSFKRCYRAMEEMGLKPVAYSYPNGAGKEEKTKKALAESGFLSGRMHFTEKMTAPYIMPDPQTEPEDWFGLPTLVMQDYAFEKCKRCVNNNDQLLPYLDETIRQKAWIIMTYHAIGDEKGYGFFKFDEFKKNILAIKERNFWNASMNAVTLYIRERLHAQVKMTPVLKGKNKKVEEISIIVSDTLPNDIYDQPLTILFTIPAYWIKKPIALTENGKTIETFAFDSTNAMISIKPDEMERVLVIKK
jgi:hypothetical protein